MYKVENFPTCWIANLYISQILVDRNDPSARDVSGFCLPSLVYLAREKRPQHFHNFKAGAMNALVS